MRRIVHAESAGRIRAARLDAVGGQQKQRSAKTYTLREALASWQWYGLWALLFLNTTAGIAIISQAAPMAEEITGVDRGVGGRSGRRDLDRERRGPVPLGVAVGLHRSPHRVSDDVPAPGLLFALLPAVESFALFLALACIILLCYGGGFGTMPAFAADRFGAENVGSIYGLMLTAWSFAGVLGPMLIAACVATGQYNDALYVIAGLMLVSTIIPVLLGKTGRAVTVSAPFQRRRIDRRYVGHSHGVRSRVIPSATDLVFMIFVCFVVIIMSIFGLGQQKPHHYREMARVAWENRDELPFAWRILKDGVCDGCALGTSGLSDWTIPGAHLCMVRLELMRLNTAPALDPVRAWLTSRLREHSSQELRALGRLAEPMLRRAGEPGFTVITWDEALDRCAGTLRALDPSALPST